MKMFRHSNWNEKRTYDKENDNEKDDRERERESAVQTNLWVNSIPFDCGYKSSIWVGELAWIVWIENQYEVNKAKIHSIPNNKRKRNWIKVRLKRMSQSSLRSWNKPKSKMFRPKREKKTVFRLEMQRTDLIWTHRMRTIQVKWLNVVSHMWAVTSLFRGYKRARER